MENGKARIREIDGIISRLYEDNMSGKIRDEQFMKLTVNYEAEQKKLKRTVSESEETLSETVF